jgi:plasmid replication initiation protein
MSKQKKPELSGRHWVYKHNALNEIRNNQMTLSQIRLFSIYLSKINPKDINSREVTFKLEEYAKIMDLKRFNITKLRASASELLDLTVKHCKNYEDGGFEMTSSVLFRRFKFHKSNSEEWLVTIECHNDVVELMFDLQKYYFRYKLWNALQLTSTNQQRMYEILKQYEKAGAREVTVKDLREFLGIDENEYPRWERFRTRVLEPCQKALANFTDIKFTWEEIKRGQGGKITALKFDIKKNNDYVEQLSFHDFLEEQQAVIEGETQEFEENNYQTEYKPSDTTTFLCEACNNEFASAEIQILLHYIREIIPYEIGERYKLNMYDY